jgi:hypothetical protein
MISWSISDWHKSYWSPYGKIYWERSGSVKSLTPHDFLEKPTTATYTPFLTGQLKQGLTLSFWKNYFTKVTTALYTIWALCHLLD